MLDFRRARITLTLWYVVISYSLLALFTWAVLSAEAQAFDQVVELVHSQIRGVVFNVYLQQQIDQFQGNFRQWLLLFDVVILIVATLASYFLSGRSLSPIENAMKDQQRFVGDVSHELRTPLASMAMELEALKRTEKLSLATNSTVESLQEEVQRMSGLVDGLLKIVRLEADSNETGQKQLIDWKDLVEAVVQLQRSSVKAHGLQLETDLMKAGSVEGNASELKQVVLILLDNAIKYTPTGKTIKAATRQVGRWSELTVFNTGVTIAADELEHVFDRFYRGRNARDEGSGLGLAIARSIVDAHEGTIAVASQRQGVTFRVRLRCSEISPV